MKMLWVLLAGALVVGCKSKEAQVAANGEKKGTPVEQKQDTSVPVIQTMEMTEFDSGDNYTVLSTAINVVGDTIQTRRCIA